ncbi:MAG TPA: VanW family protein [Longimicrobium sp.]|nr:VanW family protein [Longimicrobium sp.]
MSSAHPPAPSLATSIPHTRAADLVFRAKAGVLRLRRAARDGVRGRPRRHGRGEALAGAPVLGESASPLWTEGDPAERALVAGKVHNLRLAARRLDGVEVPAGAVLGFWAQVGRATRRRGFVAGRELREGCLVPSVGGGLCQLSNALHDAALRAGLEVVERHAHSRAVPGSLAEAGRDATVFWNYVDLRLRAPHPFRVEARMDAGTLTVRFRGVRPGAADGPADADDRPGARPRLRVLRVLDGGPRSCASCGEEACFRHMEAPPAPVGRAAHLVDEWWPEHDRHLASVRRPGDVLGVPLDGRRFGKPGYAWTTDGAARVRQSWRVALARAWLSRRLAAQGAARQRALLAYDVGHVVAAQGLLPSLWRAGHLGGRTFDVLMTSLPLATLHARLDGAARLHPESPTLADFRADAALVAAEAEALAHARRVVTPHHEVAALFPGRAEVLEWARPAPRPVRPGDGSRARVVFPGPTAGRKGAHELRAALAGLDAELVAMGSMLEGPGFWDGVRRAAPEGDWLDGADLVVLPAFVEHRPRRLLEALARGVPVVATPACGLAPEPGLALVPPGDADALREAMAAALA